MVLPELQNRGVTSVVLENYHYGALLEDGELLTWGQVNGCRSGNIIPSLYRSDYQVVSKLSQKQQGADPGHRGPHSVGVGDPSPTRAR